MTGKVPALPADDMLLYVARSADRLAYRFAYREELAALHVDADGIVVDLEDQPRFGSPRAWNM